MFVIDKAYTTRTRIKVVFKRDLRDIGYIGPRPLMFCSDDNTWFTDERGFINNTPFVADVWVYPPTYRENVLRTANPDVTDTLLNSTLGLVGESGEFADLLKKHMFHGHVFDKEKAIKELGDIRYYLELAAHSLDVTMAEVEARNVAKLTARYPLGFSVERSITKLDLEVLDKSMQQSKDGKTTEVSIEELINGEEKE